MAIGSRRTTPTALVAAAVVSEPMVAPRYTPWVQLKDWSTSGTVLARRPPKMMALMGTPRGSLANREMAGLLAMGAVNRLFGWAALSGLPFFQTSPFQSMQVSGAGSSCPSHQTSPLSVRATLVKNVSLVMLAMAFLLVFVFVPGTTPK